MSERTKKILLSSLFVLVAAAMGYGVYFFFFRPEAPGTQPPPAQPLSATLPTANTGSGTIVQPTNPGELPSAGFNQNAPPGQAAQNPNAPPTRTSVLRDARTNDISMNPSGNGVRMYNPLDGKFYRVLDDGSLVPLSDQIFYNVQQVTWGNQTNKAVLEFADGGKTIYDFNTKQQYSVPNFWQNFNFSPQDDQLAAKAVGNNENNRYLVVSDGHGQNARAIEDIGNHQDDVHVSWSPNNQTIAYSMTGDPLGFDRQAIVMLGQHHENFKQLVVEGRGFVPLWSPSGKEMLYSIYSSSNGYRPTLWVSGASGDQINANRRNLNIQTWADKCAWQNATDIVCAVPVSLSDGAGLQREAFAQVPDKIQKINVISGEITNLGQPDGAPSIKQISLAPGGQAIYFTDQSTGKLIKFNL